jgi:death on curing protein
VRYLQPSDLIRLNRSLTSNDSVGDPDDAMGGLDWQRLRDALDRHQGKVERYPDTVDERGSVLLESLLRQPPFARANEETAVLALYAFYRLNGADLDISSAEFLEYVRDGRLPDRSGTLASFLGRHRK